MEKLETVMEYIQCIYSNYLYIEWLIVYILLVFNSHKRVRFDGMCCLLCKVSR